MAKMTTSRVELQGSHREPVAGAKPVGAVDLKEQAHVTLRLARKTSQKEIDRLVDDVASQPIAKRKYLTQNELAELHGASADSIAKVDAFAHAHNLTVVETSPAKRIVKLRGSLSDLQTAFAVKLQTFKSPEVTYRGRTGAIYIPRELEGIVEGVYGLDNRPVARPHIRFATADRRIQPSSNGKAKTKSTSKQKSRPSPRASAGTSLSVPDVAVLYNFPPKLDGSGQTIALIELNTAADPSKPTKNVGAGYVLSDLNKFFSGLGIKAPQITPVSVDGGSNLPNLNPDADGEVELDIEVAGALAPGAKIAVYFAPNTDQGYIDALSNAVHDTVRTPSVISISWGGPEDLSTQQFLDGINSVLKDAVLLGITVCIAAGDSGSSDLPAQLAGRTKYKGPHVDFPASSPYALACGGTKLSSANGTIASEVVWNEGRQDGAGGGGVSVKFPPPSWQSKVPVPASPTGTAGRGSPDVCGNADPLTGYEIVLQGKTVPIGGTSAVAPLWAGLTALLNQQAKNDGKPTLGFINAQLYNLPSSTNAFHDITQGDNDIDKNLGKYKAGAGWDPCTGLGSPNGAALLQLLVRG
jgi:kumamolisin